MQLLYKEISMKIFDRDMMIIIKSSIWKRHLHVLELDHILLLS